MGQETGATALQTGQLCKKQKPLEGSDRAAHPGTSTLCATKGSQGEGTDGAGQQVPTGSGTWLSSPQGQE